ncbi:MAG: hypothetical protein JW861_12815 [Bacteroidales bacterium]|nr:hypothetical protein [Bacteroidales bacterium]
MRFRCGYIGSLVMILQMMSGCGASASGPSPLILPGSDTVQPTDTLIVRKLIILGNHITRKRIILREIVFRENDTLTATRLDQLIVQSRNNLKNTSLFNFISVDTLITAGSSVDVIFDLQERWYIWPVPIFEIADRNFNAWWEKKDLSRLNYGVFITWNNFRGRREKLILYSRFGFDEKYELSYSIPYINRSQTLGAGFSAGFSQNHEVSYNSVDNKEQYLKTITEYPFRQFYCYGETYLRKSIHHTHWFKFSYNKVHFSDSLLALNPDLSFGNRPENEYFSFFYMFKADFRDYKHYPLHGYYLDLILDKTGLGIFASGKDQTLLLKANARKFFHLSGRLYFATGFACKVSPFWHQPYYYLEGLGYGRDFVRGYEYYVVDGQHYGLLKNNLKIELIPTRVARLPFIGTEKFSKIHFALYSNIFTDLGWVSDDRKGLYNPLADELLLGSGVGIDLVTYYDLVFRIEYSINKRGETGFYIHFTAPI